MPESTPVKRSRILAHVVSAFAHRPQRELLLPAAGVVLGLLVAGAGLFRRAPQPVTVVPPGYVALVNQKGILMSDFISQTETETGTAFAQTTQAERGHVLREMINEELMVQRALVLDLPETITEVRNAMVGAVDAQVAAPLLAYGPTNAPTDAELRAFYDANRSRYTTDGTMTVHDLVLHIGGYQNADQSTAQAETDAAEAVYQLRAGRSIDYIMEHFGFVDSGRSDNTEQLDFAAKLHLGAMLYAIAARLGDGEVSEPVLDTDGVHVLVMDRRRPPDVADFSAVRERVFTDYRQAESSRAALDNLRLLRSQAQILLAAGQAEAGAEAPAQTEPPNQLE